MRGNGEGRPGAPERFQVLLGTMAILTCSSAGGWLGNGLGTLHPHPPLNVHLQASPLAPQSPLPSPPEMSPAPSPVEGWNQYSDMAGAFSLQWQVVDDIITFIMSAGVQGVHSSLSLSLSLCMCMYVYVQQGASQDWAWHLPPQCPTKEGKGFGFATVCLQKKECTGWGGLAEGAWRKWMAAHEIGFWMLLWLTYCFVSVFLCFLSRPKMHCN